MGLKFDFYKSPVNFANGMQYYQARKIVAGTKNLDDAIEYITECSTLTSADIKAVLTALSNYISHELEKGFNVNLDGIGRFSISLKTKEMEDKNGQKKPQVKVNGINFLCSPKLLQRARKIQLKHVNTDIVSLESLGERKVRLIEFLKGNGSVNATDYKNLFNCSYYRALKDVRLFLEDGTIVPEGVNTHRVYRLKK